MSLLRKSHSIEWQPSSKVGDNPNDSSAHVASIQQNFEELRGELGEFGGVFQQWLQSKRKVLISDKEAYLKRLSQEAESVEKLKKQLASLITQRQNIVTQLQHEEQEYEENVSYNGELEEQRTQLAQRLATLKEQSAKLKEQVKIEDTNYALKKNSMDEQMIREKASLVLCQEKLGLYVESVAEHVTKFSFKNIDPNNWDRLYTLTMDVSTNRFRVKCCEPMIPHLSHLLDELNGGGDFYGFLKKVRHSFSTL